MTTTTCGFILSCVTFNNDYMCMTTDALIAIDISVDITLKPIESYRTPTMNTSRYVLAVRLTADWPFHTDTNSGVQILPGSRPFPRTRQHERARNHVTTTSHGPRLYGFDFGTIKSRQQIFGSGYGRRVFVDPVELGTRTRRPTNGNQWSSRWPVRSCREADS